MIAQASGRIRRVDKKDEKMKYLEMISVRASGRDAQLASLYLRSFRREAKDKRLLGTNIYMNVFVPDDLAILLSWRERPPENDKTDVGLSLANALKQFGLIDHVFWVALDD